MLTEYYNDPVITYAAFWVQHSEHLLYCIWCFKNLLFKNSIFFQFLAVYTDSFLACILHFDFVSYNDITPQNYSIVTLLEKEKLL